MTSKQEKWTAPVVRKTFLEFFEGKGHTVGTWRGSFF
jgi:alanyl-tRNA synthetase